MYPPVQEKSRLVAPLLDQVSVWSVPAAPDDGVRATDTVGAALAVTAEQVPDPVFHVPFA